MPDREMHQAAGAPATRVHISYHVDGGAEERELPFVIGVLADLSGNPADPLPRFRDREFVEIYPENFDNVLEAAQPRVAFLIQSSETASFNVELTFRTREDFRPESIVHQVRPLRDLLRQRTLLSNLAACMTPALAEQLRQFVFDQGALHSIQEDPEAALDEASEKIASANTDSESRRERLGAQVRQFLLDAAQGAIPVSPDSCAMIAGRIAQLDRLLSTHVSAILHHASFQQLEATWRGLDFLVRRAHCSPTLKVKVLNTSRKELWRDMQRAPEFDQSAFFNKVYTEGRNSPGAEPFSLLIGDYWFSREPEDVDLIQRISHVAAAAQAPFITGASPYMFNLESFAELGMPRDLSKIFGSMEYAKWKAFRRSWDARFVGLALPRFLLRQPYGPGSAPVEDFAYSEDLQGKPHEHYLWGNAAYAFAERFAQSCYQLGWPAAVCGMETGGLIRKLPVHSFTSANGGPARLGPTEIPIDHRREAELTALGFLVFSQRRGTDEAVFYEAMSCSEPERSPTEEQNAMARDSAHLPYTLVLARFLHYGSILMHDKEHSFDSLADMTKSVNAWLQTYVGADDAATPGQKAAKPLREASAEVVPHSDASRGHQLILRARPHFRMRCPAKACQSVLAVPLAPARGE